jgi:hypothetical protein
MDKETWKQIFISIFVGAVVAFLTTFLEGALKALNGWDNNIVGGGAAAATYARKLVW